MPPYDATDARSQLRHAGHRLSDARYEHDRARELYSSLRPTDGLFPDAAQRLVLACAELLGARDELLAVAVEL